MNILVYHRADPDGWMSRAVVEHYVDIDRSIGWDFGDKPPEFSAEEIESANVIVVDLPVSLVADVGFKRKITWIDHHKSEIDKWPDRAERFDGVQTDGIAACRLAWWYYHGRYHFDGSDLTIAEFNGMAGEPYILFIIGLRDVWKHKRTVHEKPCNWLNLALIAMDDPAEFLANLAEHHDFDDDKQVNDLLKLGQSFEQFDNALIKENADRGARIITAWDMQVLTLNTQARGSKMLETKALELMKEGKQVDALMVYGLASDGMFNISWYHAPGQSHRDLSVIAKRYGGGGHPGACGARLSWKDMGLIVT